MRKEALSSSLLSQLDMLALQSDLVSSRVLLKVRCVQLGVERFEKPSFQALNTAWR